MSNHGAVDGGPSDAVSSPNPTDRDHLARLQRITAGLVGATTTDEVAQALVSSLAPSGSPPRSGVVRWCQVWLVSGNELVLAAASADAPATTVPSLDLEAGSALAQCVRRRTPMFATGTPRDVSCPPGESADLELSISAGLVPIVLRDNSRGLIVAAYPPDGPVESDEREFLATVVGQAAQALERAELYSQQLAMAEASNFLAESAQIVAEASGYAETLERLAGLALSAMGDICLIDVVDDDGVIQRKVGRHRDRNLQPLVDRLTAEYPPEAGSHHPAVEVFSTGRSSWAPDMDDEFLRHSTQDVIHYQLVKGLGFRSYMSVPLRNADEVQGTLTLVSSQRRFGPADVAFAERLALQVAGVVNNARRFDASQETAQTLQHALLPRQLPVVAGLEIETRYLPATRGLEVGGDFYDVVVLPSNRVGFMIGDVAGHDRDAAATMGQLRSAARALAGQVREPAALIAALQWSWELLGFDRIATAIFGRLDQSNGDLVLASAGHHPPLLLTPEAAARFLPVTPSTPLGAPAAPATEWVGTLVPGQVLLLYTDGVIDGRSTEDDPDGMERLARVAAGGQISPAAVCDRVIGALPEHRTDDVALLAFQLAL